ADDDADHAHPHHRERRDAQAAHAATASLDIRGRTARRSFAARLAWSAGLASSFAARSSGWRGDTGRRFELEHDVLALALFQVDGSGAAQALGERFVLVLAGVDRAGNA